MLQRLLKHTDTLGEPFFAFDATLSIERNRRDRWREMAPAVTAMPVTAFNGGCDENQKILYVTATIPLGEGVHRTVAYEISLVQSHGCTVM